MMQNFLLHKDLQVRTATFFHEIYIFLFNLKKKETSGGCETGFVLMAINGIKIVFFHIRMIIIFGTPHNFIGIGWIGNFVCWS